MRETAKKSKTICHRGAAGSPLAQSLTFSSFPVQWCQQSPRYIIANLELTRLWKWQWMDSPARPRRLGSELGAPSFSGMRSSFCKRKSLYLNAVTWGGKREGTLKGLGEIQISCGASNSSLPLVPKPPLYRCFHIIELTEHSLLARWLQGQLCGKKGICECLPVWDFFPLLRHQQFSSK